jgi:hypothetical protein
LCAMFGKVGTHTRDQTRGCILSRLAIRCQPMGWEKLIANRCLSYRCLPYSNATLWCPPCPRCAIGYPNHIGCLIGQSDWACNLSADHGWVLTSSNMSHRTPTRRAGARWEFVGGSGYPPVISRRVACPIRLANEIIVVGYSIAHLCPRSIQHGNDCRCHLASCHSDLWCSACPGLFIKRPHSFGLPQRPAGWTCFLLADCSWIYRFPGVKLRWTSTRRVMAQCDFV